jgi:Cysteine-rich secretory protein family
MVLARRLWLTAVAVAGALLVSLLLVPSASASTGSSFVSLVNSARASHGLHGYAVSSQLTSVALGQAQRMAAQNRLYHNPSLATQVTGWKYVGENVGYGPDVTTLFQAFMNSTPHRDNILDHDFTQIGVGAVTVGGTVWVSMVFREPLHATSSSTKSVPRPKPTTSRAAVSHATAGRAPAKRALPPVPAPAASSAADAGEPGFLCLATPAVADRVKDVTDLDRSARLVASAQLLVRGYQCGRGLPMTGVLDDLTLTALSQV